MSGHEEVNSSFWKCCTRRPHPALFAGGIYSLPKVILATPLHKRSLQQQFSMGIEQVCTAAMRSEKRKSRAKERCGKAFLWTIILHHVTRLKFAVYNKFLQDSQEFKIRTREKRNPSSSSPSSFFLCRNLYHNGKKAQSREGKEGSQSPS